MDGDLTSKVLVLGNVDTTKLEDYEIKYFVNDSSQNKREQTRIVHVNKLNPVNMTVKEYTLDGWYDEAKLKETDNMGEEYFVKVKDFNSSYSPERLVILENRLEKELGNYLIYIVASDALEAYNLVLDTLE